MTGNQVKGKSFRGALRYNLEKVEKDKAEILDHSFVNASEDWTHFPNKLRYCRYLQLLRILLTLVTIP